MDSSKNQNISKDVLEKDRRSFLKKAAYVAPSLLVLGQLTRPTESMAENSWDAGPGTTDTWTTGG